MSKAAKRRFCPAVQHEISAGECGESRISRYHCPVNCPFNPFAPEQYDQFSATEAGVIRKSLDWFLQDDPNPGERARQLDRLSGRSGIEGHAWQVAEFYYRRDGQGRTCADHWLASGLPGLKNDERVIQRAVMQLRPQLVEVHHVVDDLRVEAIDLLEPQSKPFLICDRALAARVCRFTTLLGWFFPLPHFWRSFGLAVPLPAVGTLEPKEVVDEIVRHLGGPLDSAARNDWLSLTFARFAQALDAVVLARREQMFAGLDAEFGKAIYELRAPFAACRDALDSQAWVARDALAEGERDEGFAEARVWYDGLSSRAATTPARPVLGRVLLAQAHWRLEAIGREKLAQLRMQFDQALGERVRFAGDRHDNLLAHLKAKEKKYDPSLVPPRLLENPPKLIVTSNRTPATLAGESEEELSSKLAEQFDRAWLEESIPALDGHTPREAARDPALRLALIRLLKDRVRSADEQNLESGGTTDMNWLLKELGADEIIYDPPPRRVPTGKRSDTYADDEGGFDEFEEFDPWPPLPPKAFSFGEAVARLQRGLMEFDSFADAEKTMQEAGGFLTVDVPEVVGDLLNEHEHAFIQPNLIQVWFAFVPLGCYGPDIEPQELHEAFGRQLALLEKAAKGGRDASGQFLIQSSPQPNMVQALAERLLSDQKGFPDAAKLRKDSFALMLLVLRSVIEVLDAKCRATAR